MKRQRYQEVYMRSNWRKQMMISALALTLSATNVSTSICKCRSRWQDKCSRHCTDNGEQRHSGIVGRKNGETLKNDWTQISLSPGSNATELNFAWYTQSRQMMIIQMQMFQN